MNFNSFDFGLFLVIVFGLYWSLGKTVRTQNIILVLASYIFYAFWDVRFLALIIFSTLIDYFVGIKLYNAKKNRRVILSISLICNLGMLFFFKYYNFFIESFSNTISFFGVDLSLRHMDIILPVGISFYTFQTLSYSIDIYRNKIQPTKDIIAFAAYVCFFPQLVAGPIERAQRFLPQFFRKKVFNYAHAVNGLRQFLWGLFKKIVIADNCAAYVNAVYSDFQNYDSGTLIIAAIGFSIQIYCDFSGYSDMAIGMARFFGFDLMKNFNYPYFSRDIAEFWRRWHISLSTWFRGYVYIPLGGSRGDTQEVLKNIFVVFIISGLWHGANWTFICWGGVHALLYVPLFLFKKNRNHLDTVSFIGVWPSIKNGIKILSTFTLVTFSWIFFRSDTIKVAFAYISNMFSFSLHNKSLSVDYLLVTIIVGFFVIEWMGRKQEYAIEKLFLNNSRLLRYSFYLTVCILLFVFNGKKQEFIYFQF